MNIEKFNESAEHLNALISFKDSLIDRQRSKNPLHDLPIQKLINKFDKLIAKQYGEMLSFMEDD